MVPWKPKKTANCSANCAVISTSLGWASGTGGGISLKEGGRIYMAPSGVQKERLLPEDIFVLNEEGEIQEEPGRGIQLSQCAPLFMHAYKLRNAGAVLHSHSIHANLVTQLFDKTFRIQGMEMQKGLEGYGAFDSLEVPIIENTAQERDLADSLAQAILDSTRRDPCRAGAPSRGLCLGPGLETGQDPG